MHVNNRLVIKEHKLLDAEIARIVNGDSPYDAFYGIVKKVFDITLEGLSPSRILVSKSTADSIRGSWIKWYMSKCKHVSKKEATKQSSWVDLGIGPAIPYDNTNILDDTVYLLADYSEG